MREHAPVTDPAGARPPHRPAGRGGPPPPTGQVFVDPVTGRPYRVDPATGTTAWLPAAPPRRRRRWPFVVIGSTGAVFLLGVLGSLTAKPAPTTPISVAFPSTSSSTASSSTATTRPVSRTPAPKGSPTPTRTAAAAPATTRTTTPPAAPPTAHPQSADPAPATTAPAPPPPNNPPPGTATACHPLTNGGKCYEPGEFCRKTDHGVSGLAGDGKAIICRDANGWRWEPV